MLYFLNVRIKILYVYARVIGLRVSNRDLNFPHVLSSEPAAYPPSMFYPNGSTRLATGKSMLKRNLAVEVPLKTLGSLTAVIIGVSAALWTIDWFTKATVQTFIQGCKV